MGATLSAAPQIAECRVSCQKLQHSYNIDAIPGDEDRASFRTKCSQDQHLT